MFFTLLKIFEKLDFWIRKKMDENGCLPITTIASFKRVKDLTNQEDDRIASIEMALEQSKSVEIVVKNGQKLVRARQSPTKWVLTEKEQKEGNIPDSLLPASASSVEILGQSNQQTANQTKQV